MSNKLKLLKFTKGKCPMYQTENILDKKRISPKSETMVGKSETMLGISKMMVGKSGASVRLG